MTGDPEDIPVDTALVARLIEAQAPQWAHLPLHPVASSGTDNAMFRLGDGLAVRLPRRASAVALLSKELDWLPHLQGLPLEVPMPRFRGRVTHGIPCDFGVVDWIEGEIAAPRNVADWSSAARALADFLKALHEKDTGGAPRAGACNSRRGVALRDLSGVTVPALDAVADEVDLHRATALWELACAAPMAGPSVWLHGDLKADNLIVRDGALHGVIDWGLSAVGDPAADYAAAWSWVDATARAVFRDHLCAGEADWQRAGGWALYGAVVALSYYRGGRNEALFRQSRQTLSRLGLLL